MKRNFFIRGLRRSIFIAPIADVAVVVVVRLLKIPRILKIVAIASVNNGLKDKIRKNEAS